MNIKVLKNSSKWGDEFWIEAFRWARSTSLNLKSAKKKTVQLSICGRRKVPDYQRVGVEGRRRIAGFHRVRYDIDVYPYYWHDVFPLDTTSLDCALGVVRVVCVTRPRRDRILAQFAKQKDELLALWDDKAVMSKVDAAKRDLAVWESKLKKRKLTLAAAKAQVTRLKRKVESYEQQRNAAGD